MLPKIFFKEFSESRSYFSFLHQDLKFIFEKTSPTETFINAYFQIDITLDFYNVKN
jgi:hypothetical protein